MTAAHTGNVRSIASAQPKKPRATPKKKQREYLYAEGPARAMAIYLERTAERLMTHIARAKGYGLPPRLMIAELMNSAVVALNEACEGLDRVPKAWKPVRGSVGGIPIAEGTFVVVREEKRSIRIELRDAAVELEVVQIVGGKTVCEVTSGPDKGMRVMIPRSHLVKVT